MCFPSFNPLAPVEEAADQVGDWVNDVPGVASDIKNWGENFATGAGECGYELLPPYQFESSPCHDFYEESIEELEKFGEELEPEDPDDPKPPILGPPPIRIPGPTPAPIP